MTPEQIKQIAIEEGVWPSREVERQRFIKAAKRIAQMQRESDATLAEKLIAYGGCDYETKDNAKGVADAIRNNTGE